jgi:gamma-glutamyl AIG2-like cyclotransferase
MAQGREAALMGDPAGIYLFSYGTLQQEGVQIASFGRLLKGADDALPGYKQSMLEITDPEVIRTSGKKFHPIVAASDDPSDEVPGRVFEITAAELAAADAYEVADYKRILVRLKSGVDAFVYVKA